MQKKAAFTALCWPVGPQPASMGGGLVFGQQRGAGVQQRLCSFAAAAAAFHKMKKISLS
jgi:hypothetical protein